MRREVLYLTDIVEAADHIAAFIAGVDFEGFKKSEMVRSAVVQKLSIIGEAAARVSKTVTHRYPQIPWPQIVAFRNILVHAYFGIDWDDGEIREEKSGTDEHLSYFLSARIREMLVCPCFLVSFLFPSLFPPLFPPVSSPVSSVRIPNGRSVFFIRHGGDPVSLRQAAFQHSNTLQRPLLVCPARWDRPSCWPSTDLFGFKITGDWCGGVWTEGGSGRIERR
jgi:uncharacterized protein with HEPN domain